MQAACRTDRARVVAGNTVRPWFFAAAKVEASHGGGQDVTPSPTPDILTSATPANGLRRVELDADQAPL
jgi:hypothetical protein